MKQIADVTITIPVEVLVQLPVKDTEEATIALAKQWAKSVLATQLKVTNYMNGITANPMYNLLYDATVKEMAISFEPEENK